MSTATPNVADASSEEHDVTAATCPKCHTTTPWKESSWCPDCGYYPGITDAVPEDAQPEDAQPVAAAAEPEKQPMLPSWVTASIGGATGIIVLSIAANYYFTYYGGDRSLTSLLVLLTGFGTFLGAHLITSFAAIKQSTDAALFDIIGRPIEMWRPTIQDLPKTGKRIICGVCGLAATFSSLGIIGGLDFNSIFEKEEVVETRPGVFKRIVSGAAAAAPEEDQPDTIEEALEAVEPEIEQLDAASSALLPSPDEPLNCVIYGFMNDGSDEELGRLLLAAEIRGIRVHVGTLPAKKLPPHIREELTRRLPTMIEADASVDSRYRGTWVNPSLAFDIDFQGWAMTGELIKPRISMKVADN